jgi:hypothetical protein
MIKVPQDKIYYYWFNQGLRSIDDLDMIKISIGTTKFIIEFGTKYLTVKRQYFRKDIVDKANQLFKSTPLVGTSSLEEVIMLDGYREYIVYNNAKIYQTHPENPLICSFKTLINYGLGKDFIEMSFLTFDLLKDSLIL